MFITPALNKFALEKSPFGSGADTGFTNIGAMPAVYPLYTQGRTLIDLGVLPGYDLTHEAAFAKLLWLVSRDDLTFGKRQEIFQQPVAGEMSV
jgi:hypothetical protein